MLIPKQIAALAKIVAKQPGRYAKTAVRIERRNGAPRALATDDRRAVVFSWEEPAGGDYPPIAGMNPKTVPSFAVNVPPQILQQVARGVPSRSPKPVLSFALLDESSEKPVRLAATTLDKITRAEANSEEADFPNVDEVLPQPAKEGNIYCQKKHGPAKFTHVRIAINAKQFAQTLEVLADLVAEDDKPTVVLTVPIFPSYPIRMDARCSNRRATAIIMPVNADFEAYDRLDRPAAPPVPSIPAKQPAQRAKIPA